MTKLEVLAEYLEVDTDAIEEPSDDSDEPFSLGNQEYLVLTDSEADELAEDYILNSLWAFNASFIASHAARTLSANAVNAIQKMQEKLCEDSNDLIACLIADLEHFIQDAISSDGRGHFISQYDGEEVEHGDYYIYRVN